MRVINNKLYQDSHLSYELHCPHCNAIMNTATSPESGLYDGDFGICVGCGEIVVCVVDEQNKISLRKADGIDIALAKKNGMYDTLVEYQTMIRTTEHGLKVKRQNG